MAQKQKKVKYILEQNGYTTDEKNTMSVLGSDDAIFVEFKDSHDVDFMASQNTTMAIPIEQLPDTVSALNVYVTGTSTTAVTYASGTTRHIILDIIATLNGHHYNVAPQTDYLGHALDVGFTFTEATATLTIGNTVSAGVYTEQITYSKVGGSSAVADFSVTITT